MGIPCISGCAPSSRCAHFCALLYPKFVRSCSPLGRDLFFWSQEIKVHLSHLEARMSEPHLQIIDRTARPEPIDRMTMPQVVEPKRPELDSCLGGKSDHPQYHLPIIA